MLILFTINIEFNTVISSSDGFYIKINKFIHLNTFEIVKKYNRKQVYEYSNRSCNQTKLFSLILVCFWNFTNIIVLSTSAPGSMQMNS